MTCNVLGTRLLFFFVYIRLLIQGRSYDFGEMLAEQEKKAADKADKADKAFKAYVQELQNANEVSTDLLAEDAKNGTQKSLPQQPVLKDIQDKVLAPWLNSFRKLGGDDMIPGSLALSQKIWKAVMELQKFKADNFNITIPPSEISIEKGTENETFTERFVHGLKASRLELPCSAAMSAQSPFTDFQWSLRDALITFTSNEGRLKLGTKKELIFEILYPMDSGRYTCDGKVNGLLHTNVANLHVFVPADVVMGFPLKFRAAHCNKDEDLSIKSQIQEIFCSSYQSCSFEFTTTCSSTPWFKQTKADTLPAVVQVLALKYTNPSYQTPTCAIDCVMRAKLKNILSEMSSFVMAFKKVGENVRRVGHCIASSCSSDYVFVPEDTVDGSKVLYVCDAGFVLYRTSACVPCWAGEFAPSRGPTEDCSRCPVLTYQPTPASASCIPCTNATTNTTITGAINADMCLPEGKKEGSSVAFRAILFLLVIFLLAGIIVAFIVIICYRQKLMVVLAKAKAARKAKDGGVQGEKEPLKPGKKPSAIGVPKKSSAFFIGKKPSKIASKASVTRTSSKTVAQRRASDFPLMVAESKQGTSIPTQPVKSAPVFGHDPSRTADVGASPQARAINETSKTPLALTPLTLTTAAAQAPPASTTPVVIPEPAKAIHVVASAPGENAPVLTSVASTAANPAPVVALLMPPNAPPSVGPEPAGMTTQVASSAPPNSKPVSVSGATTAVTYVPVYAPFLPSASSTQVVASAPVNTTPSLVSVASATAANASVVPPQTSSAAPTTVPEPTNTNQSAASASQTLFIAPEPPNTPTTSQPGKSTASVTANVPPGEPHQNTNQNTNQSSRLQPSMISQRSAGSTFSDRSPFSVTQAAFPTESYKKLLGKASNIKLHVVRLKPEQEKTPTFANMVSDPTEPADGKSTMIPEEPARSDVKWSPVASPLGPSGKTPSASPLASSEDDIKSSSAKSSAGNAGTNTKSLSTAAMVHLTGNLKSEIETDRSLNNVRSKPGAALNTQSMNTETATAGATRTTSADNPDTNPASALPGTDKTHQHRGFQTSFEKTTNPSANNNNVNWNAIYSESSWDEEDVELWSSYKVTETNVLVDGADDELDSRYDLTIGTNKSRRKLVKR